VLKLWKCLGRIGIGVTLLLVSIGPDAVARVQRLKRPPNLVLIIGDDHGWPYSGFMGNDTVATPYLDALAADGTVFTHVFSSAAVCRPALQTLLSGMDGAAWQAQYERTNVTFGSPLSPRFEVRRYQTLPRQLARRGYLSFQAGKHWEGSFWRAGFTAGTTKIVDPNFGSLGDRFGRPSIEPLTDFLDTVGETPFFLWLAPKIPHLPLDPPPELQAPYRALGLVEPAVLYYANITRLDRLIGEMLGELRARGLERDTIIVYVSDNGWEQEPDQNHFLGPWIGGPRGKASMYELGYRAPTIIHWPGHVRSGRRDSGLATFEDLHATLLDYAGVALPPDHSGTSLRKRSEGRRGPGRNAVFSSTTTLRVREEESNPGPGFIRFEDAAYVRTRRWRYIAYFDRDEHELYRIDRDPFEEFDVADQYPGVVARLSEMLTTELEQRAQPATVMEVAGRLRRFPAVVPVSGLPLQLNGVNEGGQVTRLQVVTASDGSFRFPNVPAGHYALTMPEGRMIFDFSQVLEHVPLVLTGLQTGPYLELFSIGLSDSRPQTPVGWSEIGGTFLDRQGDPLPALPIHLRAWSHAGNLQLQLLTGPDGSFSMDRLPRGLYLLSAGLQPGDRGRYLFLPSAARVHTQSRLVCAPDGSCSRIPGLPHRRSARNRR